jgi:hypothetical protein
LEFGYVLQDATYLGRDVIMTIFSFTPTGTSIAKLQLAYTAASPFASSAGYDATSYNDALINADSNNNAKFFWGLAKAGGWSNLGSDADKALLSFIQGQVVSNLAKTADKTIKILVKTENGGTHCYKVSVK